MKDGDMVRNKATGFTGRISGTKSRMVEGKLCLERVLILREGRPGTSMWCDVADVELVVASEPPA